MSSSVSQTVATRAFTAAGTRRGSHGVSRRQRVFDAIANFGEAPVRWPIALVLLAMFGVCALCAVVGFVCVGDARSAAVVFLLHAFLFLYDTWLLRTLPARGISFGAVRAQIFVLHVPRVLVTVAGLGFVALFGELAGAVLITGGFALASQCLGCVLYFYGMRVEARRVGLTRRTLAFFGHTPRPAGTALRVLHLTDLHVERFGVREAAVLQLAAETRPDLIVLTGDFLGTSYREDPATHDDLVRLLGGLRAPLGVYASMGTPPVDRRPLIASICERAGVRLLRDEALLLEHAGRVLALLGVDCTHIPEQDCLPLAALLAQVPAEVPRLLLYHSPELMPVIDALPPRVADVGVADESSSHPRPHALCAREDVASGGEAARPAIDLYLCGHTHGGQIRVPGFGALFTASLTGKRYEMGAYQNRPGGTTLYVSRGVGLEGTCAPRMRLFCPPEVVLWELH